MNISMGRSFIPAAGSVASPPRTNIASPPRNNISIVDLTKCGTSSSGKSFHNVGGSINDKDRTRSAVSRRNVILVNGNVVQNVSVPNPVYSQRDSKDHKSKDPDVNLQDQVCQLIVGYELPYRNFLVRTILV
jgi:hypothetical protein